MRNLTLVVGAFLVLGVGLAGADPVNIRSGKVVLPLTGLEVELPRDARKGATWSLTGSWSLSDGGKAFDGRDVIDQKVGDRIVRGDWIHAGFFDAGDCAAVVKETVLADRWDSETDLYGERFLISGGTYDLEGELGKVSTLVLCAEKSTRKTLLIYHFFVAPRAPTGKAALAAIAKDKLLARVTQAWRTDATGDARPTHRPEIRRRGEIAAARTATLPLSGLELAMPDDGYIWLVRPRHDEAVTDFLDRMAPAMPDLTLEVALVARQTCREFILSLVPTATFVEEPPPLGVPLRWKAYPTILADDLHERVICRDLAGNALVVGLLGVPRTATASRDFGPLATMIQALADAATP